MTQWNPGTIYLRITPKVGESSFVSRHQCWDKERFAASQREAHFKTGGVVEMITEEEYNEEMKPQRGKR